MRSPPRPHFGGSRTGSASAAATTPSNAFPPERIASAPMAAATGADAVTTPRAPRPVQRSAITGPAPSINPSVIAPYPTALHSVYNLTLAAGGGDTKTSARSGEEDSGRLVRGRGGGRRAPGPQTVG